MTALPAGRLTSLLENSLIDWDGACLFDDDGKVLSFVKPSISNSPNMRPIPKSEAVLNDAKEADKLLKSIAQPVNKRAFAGEMAKLANHCGLQNRSEKLVESLVADCWEDLKHLPYSLIFEACKRYRRQEQGNQYFPKSGQLLALVKKEYAQLQKQQKRIDLILGRRANKPFIKRNRPVSAFEAAQNLKEKFEK